MRSLCVFPRRLFWRRWQPKLSKLNQHFFLDLAQELSNSTSYCHTSVTEQSWLMIEFIAYLLPLTTNNDNTFDILHNLQVFTTLSKFAKSSYTCCMITASSNQDSLISVSGKLLLVFASSHFWFLVLQYPWPYFSASLLRLSHEIYLPPFSLCKLLLAFFSAVILVSECCVHICWCGNMFITSGCTTVDVSMTPSLMPPFWLIGMMSHYVPFTMEFVNYIKTDSSTDIIFVYYIVINNFYTPVKVTFTA
jgi:hypothetical protein